MDSVRVNSEKVRYTDVHIEADYDYQTTRVDIDHSGRYVATPQTTRYTFRTQRKVPKLGVMLVGWGGNNGTTVTAAVLANKLGLSWNTKDGERKANYYGSITHCATVNLGTGPNGEVFVPLRDMLPMVHANDIVFDDFVAANQEQRADNVLTGSKQELLNKIRQDIADFKKSSGVDKITRLAPQMPQFLGLVYIAGDDFKSGQTKLKSVLVDFLVGAGIKPTSIVSYNHLGNNDGLNLSAPQTFRSKEISKSSVVDDMVESNSTLYGRDEKPDHCVVIKYVPYVGDSKRAMDEYTSEIMMGGHNTIVIHNTCEDSLLASPLILDLVILAELCERITYKTEGEKQFHGFNSVLSILSFLCKAPLVPAGTPIVNALFRQRACIENVLRACIGLAPVNHMLLEYKAETIAHNLQSVSIGSLEN
nr:hypothetical protein BaRGS_030689 [Batillaria attramentaria]